MYIYNPQLISSVQIRPSKETAGHVRNTSGHFGSNGPIGSAGQISDAQGQKLKMMTFIQYMTFSNILYPCSLLPDFGDSDLVAAPYLSPKWRRY